MKRKAFYPLFFSLLLTISSGFQPALAHNGVDHGNAKHQKVAGIDVILELHSQAHYREKFGAQASLQGSHVLTVKLLNQNQPITQAQLKTKLIGPNRKTIGAESGQALTKIQGKNPHYATAYTLTPKGKYAVMVMFKAGNKVSQATFEVMAP